MQVEGEVAWEGERDKPGDKKWARGSQWGQDVHAAWGKDEGPKAGRQVGC